MTNHDFDSDFCISPVRLSNHILLLTHVSSEENYLFDFSLIWFFGDFYFALIFKHS